jgi:hypothetical protein
MNRIPKQSLRILCLCLAMLSAGAASRAQEFRDPMRPAGVAPVAARQPVYSLKLEGVIAGVKRVAIVNGRLVRTGDVVAGARIVEVFANGVRYERAGKTQTLTLPAAQSQSTVRVARSEPKPEAP